MPDLTMGRLFLSELEAAGVPVPAEAVSAMAVHDEIAAALNDDPAVDLRLKVLSGAIAPKDAMAAVRQAALDDVVSAGARQMFVELQHPLASRLTTAVRDGADDIVRSLRPAFDEGVAVLQAASKAGVTADTDPASIVNGGSDDLLEAYRNLRRAGALMDAAVGLRNSLARTFLVGPTDPGVCFFLTSAAPAGAEPTVDALDAAQRIYDGVDTSSAWAQRLGETGGPFMRLVAAGYQLRLNTGPEAACVVRDAEAGSEAMRAERRASGGMDPADRAVRQRLTRFYS